MENIQINATYQNDKGTYLIETNLLQFQEDNVTIIYSPAFDVTGYGYTLETARDSFTEVMEEFLRYTTAKETLRQELKNLGWTMRKSKKRPKFRPPTPSHLVSKNPTYKDILDNKEFTQQKGKVELAY